MTDSQVRDVLHFLALPPNWINLYKVQELVSDEMPEGVYDLVPEPKLRAFKGTAQSRSHLGDEARHASRKIHGPAKPMTLRDARRLIWQLAEKWMERRVR